MKIICVYPIPLPLPQSQEANGPQQLPEYHKLYTELLSEVLIFVYQRGPYDKINKNQQWQEGYWSITLNAVIAINVLFIDTHHQNYT